MINSKFLKLLILPILALFCVPLFASAQVTQTDGNLEVTFEQVPLFENINIAPGFSVTRTVSVKNNGSETEDVYVSLTSQFSDGLADVLNLTITSTTTTPNQLYSGTLASFFNAVPVSLGSLAGGQTHTYDFNVSMDSGVGNPYQGKGTGFNLLVGFEGSTTVVTGGGGGGGSTGPTEQIAGASTGPNDGIWNQIINRLGDLARGAPAGSAGQVSGSSSEQVAGTSTEEIGENGLIDSFINTIESKDWCKVFWLLIVVWLIASAFAYWRQNAVIESLAMRYTQVFFGVLSILILISSFIFALQCAFWPAFITAAGSAFWFWSVRGE